MIVSCTEVQIGLEMALFPTDDEEDFAVCFQADQSVDDVDAGLLHFAGPGDVIGFIEAGFQFNEDRYLFFVPGGGNESVEEGRIPASSIEGHLDCEDLRIDGSLFEKRDDGLKTFVGMMQEDVVLADCLEAAPWGLQWRWEGRGEEGIVEVGEAAA